MTDAPQTPNTPLETTDEAPPAPPAAAPEPTAAPPATSAEPPAPAPEPEPPAPDEAEYIAANKYADPPASSAPDLPLHYFLIDPRNEPVVRSQSRELPPLGARTVFLFGIPFLLVGLGLIVWAVLRWQAVIPMAQAGNATGNMLLNASLLTLGVFLFNVFVLGLYLSGFRLAQKRSQLEKKGDLLWGEVMASSGIQDRDGDLTIRVEYRFQEPSRRRRKRYIEGKVREFRNDLKESALPAPGTPVAILYLNRNNYEIL